MTQENKIYLVKKKAQHKEYIYIEKGGWHVTQQETGEAARQSFFLHARYDLQGFRVGPSRSTTLGFYARIGS